ncbi:MAG: FHA domain-containing protein [Anaerolineales bacterium]|nr:FHA domain-containing protein [Anaerolineales bacterium]
MASSYVIRHRMADADWQEYEFSGANVLFGRGEDCDLVLKHREVSRHHARLRRMGEELQLIDLDSSNGTLLAGKEIVPNFPTTLKPGQTIEIGPFTLEIQLVTDDATYISSEPAGVGEGYLLRYRKGSDDWQEVAFSDGQWVVGRAADCDLSLDDHEASRQHARITALGTDFAITDLGSTNGTRLDGKALEPHQDTAFRPGQIIQIGSYELVLSTPSAVTGQAAPELRTEVSERPPEKPAPRPASPTPVPASPVASSAPAGIPPAMTPTGDAGQTMIESESELFKDLPVRTMNLMSHERVTIGRENDNNVVLKHPMVSRYHAIIERMGTRFRIQDLRSTNGVFVNGKRIENEAFLKDYDQIRIGPYAFVLAGQNLQAQATQGLKLEARNINQRVSSTLNLLKDINLTIKPNEFVALVGMSGSGKTTLLNALSGYWPASQGDVLVDGISLYGHYDLFRNDIGYVPQKDIVHAELTPEVALDYVAQLRMPPDVRPEERKAVVSEVLKDLDLTERRNVPISKLSGGQLKRVSIGCELLTKPRLFFLDEPTSGLDPGTEYDMMKLMRRLADQGRTVILITHATKNVMLCDKVIFLARGGNMAFFGAPEDALEYFNQYRTDRERREKQMEFDDIYRILNDEARGAPEEWRARYLSSQHAYAAMGYEAPYGQAQPAGSQSAAVERQSTRSRVSPLRQFMILSSRNLKILAQDKVSLALMLALAPMIGLMDFIWGRDLYDPVQGDAGKLITMWFMTALVTVLVGALSSVREIVKEVDIYKRERAVNLKILPYVLSKVWVGLVLALYQAVVLLLFRVLFVNPELSGSSAYLSLYVTLFLGTLCGYLIGLAISASAPNQNAAMMLIIVVLVPQFLFAGALLPLDLIPGGEQISTIMPTRWSFEAFIRIAGLGEQLVNDPCWTGFDKADRLKLPEELKENCPCMGASIFTACTDFPGILSPDFYDNAARQALVQSEPQEPPQPTAYPYPTALPSPTSLPTPTLLPSLTPLPTPENPQDMATYMDARAAQGDDYQDLILGQFEQYRLDSQAQGEAYSDVRTAQGDEYADLRQTQGDEYSVAMRVYGDDRAEWQEAREKAISSAEGVLGSIYDNYQQTFKGAVFNRWVLLIVIMAALSVFVLVFQKRKDVV